MIVSPTPAAEYLRMSTEHQQYSLDFQSQVNRSYAIRNNFTIVRSYVDAGKSGLALKHRDGLAQLLHDVVAGGQEYKAILVYDVSRWGRFQNTDEAAHYEFLCTHAGAPVHYCAETFSNERTMANTIIKSLKRIMAAEYSRELSDKVFHCMTRMVAQGRWVGGNPGYGLRRMFVSADGTRQYPMDRGEHKELRHGHVIVIPGPAHEVACVREIFRMYIEERKSTMAIAKELNKRRIPRDGVPWNYRAVVSVLFNEKYAGSLVWHRWTQKLTGHYIPVPRDQWIVQPGAIEPIVDINTFKKAQQIRDNFAWNRSDQDLLDMLRAVLASRGRLTAQIINKSKRSPSSTTYAARFGSLPRAYELIGYKRTGSLALRFKTRSKVKKLHCEVFRKLRRIYGKGIKAIRERQTARPRRLRFSCGLEVSLAVCLSEKTLKGVKRWRFQSSAAQQSGLVTLLCLCNTSNTGFREFLVVPSMAHVRVVSLLSENDARLLSSVRLNVLRRFRTVARQLASLQASKPR